MLSTDPAPGNAQATPDILSDDEFLWLEDWTGPRAMEWVKRENAQTQKALQEDPRFQPLFESALAVASAKDRIANPFALRGSIYNFWRDADHPQGLWRRTTRADYATGVPNWTVVLDLDHLSARDNSKWVWKGASVLDLDENRAMIALSDGGEDAVVFREFDLENERFVDDGFRVPKAKQYVAWFDRDTILISRDWGEGSTTASGYPFVIKALRRGDALEEAREVFRGDVADQLMSLPFVLTDAEGNRAPFALRGVTFFGHETHLLTERGLQRLALPHRARLTGMVGGQVLIRVNEDWESGGMLVPAGSLASVPLEALQAEGELHPRVLFAPNARQSIDEVTTTRSRVLVTINDNVRGRMKSFALCEGSWTAVDIPLPDHSVIGVAGASDHTDEVYFSVAGFLSPNSLWRMEECDGVPVQVAAMPARFNASGLCVEQFEAVSSDGTAVPYFIVRRSDMPLDGSTPTLINAYGGFEIAMLPGYNAMKGKLWLERGNSFVLANIRGGGEFGPQWHEAGRKTNRQIIYDDFAAVARDLCDRGFSSPAKLGIYGGSNGGLLMGVQLTQRPAMWGGVVIQVPLLDMLRYEQIAAGSSWVDEYGSVSNPEEQAFLKSVSPYANLRSEMHYPRPFVWTTTKDDRVGPQHARKFSARMQAYGHPCLFYEDLEGGHAGDADIAQQAKLQAMEIVYFSQQLED